MDRQLDAAIPHQQGAGQRIRETRSRALVEADFSRFKRMIGGELRSRTDRRRGTEIALAVSVLNQMLELGRPEYIRLA